MARSKKSKRRTIVHPTARRELHRWLSCPSGKTLLDRERELLDGVLPHLFGHHILQVGRLGEVELLAHSRIAHRVVLGVSGDGDVPGYPCLWAEPDALPVASDSVDVVVLPHLLEFSPRMHETIREAERVLVAEGHLLILAFNAWSLIGLWRLLYWRRGAKGYHIPYQGGQFPSLNRIERWIAALGFEVISIDRYFFQPPIDNRRLMDRLRFLDVIGPRFWPFLSGAYFIVAKKRVTTLTPIKLRTRQPRRPLVAVGLGQNCNCLPSPDCR